MKLASETERSVILSSSRRKRKRGNDLQLVKRPAPHVSGTCASQRRFTECLLGGFREGVFRFAAQGGGSARTWPLLSALPSSIPVTASLPPLEWPLPHQSGAYELRIEVQPKPHHRAHYETEGSRGAVKAPTGGHPVVQVRTCVPALWLSSWATGPRLLLGRCVLLMRLRCVSQLPVPPRDGKPEIECRQLIKPLTSQEKGLPDLRKDRSDTHAVFSLLFLIEKLL